MLKNVASQKIALFAFDYTTGAPKTGDAANITAYVNKDWGGITVLGDTTATEIDSTNAKGWYLFDLTQAETNADTLHFTGKSSTANISVVGILLPTYVAQTGDSFARIGATGSGLTSITGLLPAALSAAGFIKADIFGFLGTAFTEGAVGRLAANIKTFFNVNGATGTQDVIPTTTNLTNAPPDSAGVTTLLTRIPAALFSGITSLANWLGAGFGKQAADATAITEIRARGAGSGTFDATTDSLEAARDNLGTNGAALVLAKTTNLTGLNDINAATVKTQVTDALNVDANAEVTSVPAATAPVTAKMSWLFALSRNKRQTTATGDKVRNDADGADIGNAVLSDDTTTFTRGKYT